jgi:hypothetical protein
LFSGCAPVLFEEARIRPGNTLALGAGLLTTPFIPDMDEPAQGYSFSPAFALDWRYGYSERVAVFWQLLAGYTWTRYWHYEANGTGSPFAAGQAGMKVALTRNRRHALKLAIGFLYNADVTYLCDPTEQLTVAAGLGTWGLHGNVIFHHALGDEIIGHLNIGVSLSPGIGGINPPSLSLGAGVEYLKPQGDR